MNTFEQLESHVIDWAREKGILDKATPMAQGLKTLEEVTEMLQAIRTEDRDELIDSIGDILVTIIIQSELNSLKSTNCLQSAYDIISKRKGKMVNGIFIKDK